ncbi:MAG: TetR family transcriptional regulator [Acidimicrobiales bacterium]
MTTETITDAPSADDLAADPRYQRLMRATYRAAGEGYDAVTMRRLAAEARMSLAKIYEYGGSKDELIARAHAGGMGALRADLERHPPAATTTAERVSAALDRFSDALEQDEIRTRTLMRAMYSADPKVGSTMGTLGSTFGAIVDAAIGSADVADHDARVELLGDVVNSAILQWLHHRLDAEGVRARLRRAVGVLFG